MAAGFYRVGPRGQARNRRRYESRPDDPAPVPLSGDGLRQLSVRLHDAQRWRRRSPRRPGRELPRGRRGDGRRDRGRARDTRAGRPRLRPADLVMATGATACLPAGARVGFDRHALEDGERVELGNTVVTALATPGHAPAHHAYLVADRRRDTDETWLAFTGDSLLVNDAGRPDLHAGGGDPRALALAQYASMQRLLALPDHVVVLPSHYGGSVCGRGLSGNPISSIGFERRHNRALLHRTQRGSPTRCSTASPPPRRSRLGSSRPIGEGGRGGAHVAAHGEARLERVLLGAALHAGGDQFGVALVGVARALGGRDRATVWRSCSAMASTSHPMRWRPNATARPGRPAAVPPPRSPPVGQVLLDVVSRPCARGTHGDRSTDGAAHAARQPVVPGDPSSGRARPRARLGRRRPARARSAMPSRPAGCAVFCRSPRARRGPVPHHLEPVLRGQPERCRAACRSRWRSWPAACCRRSRPSSAARSPPARPPGSGGATPPGRRSRRRGRPRPSRAPRPPRRDRRASITAADAAS